MEALTYLDTHVVAWLYAGRVELLSPAAVETINHEDLLISPIVLLELEYLHETERIAIDAQTIVRSLQAHIGLSVCDLSFATVAHTSLEQSWTRDPFDRIIVGHAAAASRPLISKNRDIRRRYRLAVW